MPQPDTGVSDVPAGATVTYHGSVARAHGAWTYAGLCPCDECDRSLDNLPWFPALERHCLERDDGDVLEHVRRESFTAVT